MELAGVLANLTSQCIYKVYMNKIMSLHTITSLNFIFLTRLPIIFNVEVVVVVVAVAVVVVVVILVV